MRLLCIVQNYPPERGPVRYTRNLAVGLAARGHDVRVVTALPHYPEGRPYEGHGRFLPQRRIEEGVEVIRVPVLMAGNRQPLRRIAGMATFAASALPAALAPPRPDVVIASIPPVPVAPLGILAAAVHRAPLVAMLRDVEPRITLELRGLADRAWAKQLVRLATSLYARADRLVVVHESQARSLTDAGVAATKIETIRHGIDVERFLSQAAKPSPVSLSRRAGRKVLLYAGTMGVAHDVDALVRAFSDPGIRSLPVDLVLVGGGELVERCAELLGRHRLDNVRLLPPVSLDVVPALLSEADALVTSYRSTGRPIAGMIGSKLYEYFAAGKPVFVHGDGVAAELVTRVGNGWAVGAGDLPAFRDALGRWLADPESSERMGALGRMHARRDFSIEARNDRWEQLLVGLCGAGK